MTEFLCSSLQAAGSGDTVIFTGRSLIGKCSMAAAVSIFFLDIALQQLAGIVLGQLVNDDKFFGYLKASQENELGAHRAT